LNPFYKKREGRGGQPTPNKKNPPQKKGEVFQPFSKKSLVNRKEHKMKRRKLGKIA